MSERLILSAAGPGRCDGIGDYAWQLTRALSVGAPATLVVRDARAVTPPDDGSPGTAAGMESVPSWFDLDTPAWIARGRRAGSVIVQYSPQAFAARDFGALLSWLRARRSAGRPVVVTLHEYWPHPSLSPRREVMRWRSRRALRDLSGVSTAMIVSQPYSAGEVAASGLVPKGVLRVIPVGSGVPNVSGAAPASRPTLAVFGQPAMMSAGAVAAVARWLAATPAPPRLLWFSRSAEELRAWWQRHIGVSTELVTIHGGLPASALSRALQEATVALAPYLDGASTRRSSLAALLEHGLPVVALDGRYTDDRLRQCGAFAFVPLDTPAALPAAIATVLADADRRAAMAHAARIFFAEHLAWPRIAAAYLAAEASA